MQQRFPPLLNNNMLLKEKHRKLLEQLFSTVEFPVEVWAYGSRVSGTAHEGSDLDLVLRSADLKKLPAEVFAEVKEKIQESNIPILVEVFDWARLPESFHQNILRQYEVLFSNLHSSVNEPAEKYKTKQNPPS